MGLSTFVTHCAGERCVNGINSVKNNAGAEVVELEPTKQ
jgi:hypothetical protein